MTIRAFARLVKCRESAVRKAVSNGRLGPACLGRDARGRPMITDPARAVAEWYDNRDPVKDRRAVTPQRATVAELARRLGVSPGVVQRGAEDGRLPSIARNGHDLVVTDLARAEAEWKAALASPTAPPHPGGPAEVLVDCSPLLDHLQRVERRISAAFHERFRDPAARMEGSPAVGLWQRLYGEWARTIDVVEQLQHQVRAALRSRDAGTIEPGPDPSATAGDVHDPMSPADRRRPR